MWNQLESLTIVWNYSCTIVLFHCFDFTLLFISFRCFISVVFINFFLVRNKVLDHSCHNDVILQVLLVNNNQVTRLS
jgi:hypothetical protein